ncbi:FecR family protein [Pontibacter sp. SGAir0037]|uniref:FecR family protein n=1 Tax=Pontibacter sp. SGAir0037 TaxID=2571030 RepID=UPI0010CD252E|nr:FecR domain-containing protein [Pontibacter sp. SGAir0037]QCR23036.1 hypothetical protein C1N53_12245 [Pontibacter sp. SGAir0037]
MTNYQTIQDLMLDAHFCSWVNGTDPEAEAHWKAWLDEHPEKAELVRQAKSLVQSLNSTSNTLSEQDKAFMWEAIRNRNAHEAQHGYLRVAEEPAVGDSLRGWGFYTRVAAGFAALLVLGVAMFWLLSSGNEEYTEYSTAYGEVKNLELPDGSSVVLNANSTLRYANKWSKEKAREVQLSGEAFFAVTHQYNNQKFQVKLQDGVAVEVLGTTFTVTMRPEKTRVVLNEGKVKLSVFEERMFGLYSATKHENTLKPGELIELGRLQQVVHKEQLADPDVYAAFKRNEIVFRDAPLTEVARILKDNYGYQVTFADPELAKRRFTGTVPVAGIQVLFTALEKLFDVEIAVEDKEIRIT